MKRIVLLVLLTLAVGCAGKEENHAIRQVILQDVLAKEAVDVLVIRLGRGEARTDFGFQGDTVFFLGSREEEEFWLIRDPRLRYLFIKDISYDSQTEAQVEIEIRHADTIVSRVIDLRKVGGSWSVTLRSGLPRWFLAASTPGFATPGSVRLSLSLSRGRDR